jgi:hypothetical protein
MLTTGVRTTAVWRLGVPAVLTVAFVLVGLAQAPWRGDEARRPATAVTPTRMDATPAVGTDHPVPPAANATTDAADVREAPPGPERGASREAPAPSVRLPGELEPLAPDVVVAMDPAWPAAGLPPVVMHSHLDSAPDGDPTPALPEGAMAPAGDDIQGPEPGAWFWFGPSGLERVRIAGEAQR